MEVEEEEEEGSREEVWAGKVDVAAAAVEEKAVDFLVGQV